MRSRPSTWTTILTKLGVTRNKSYPHSARRSADTRKLRFEQCEDRLLLTTFTVNDIGDTNTFDLNDNEVTLREAIFRADQFPDADEIYFASNLDSVPIVLSEGELSITKSVTIDAAGQDITIDAQGSSRVFYISTSPDVTLTGLTITGGFTTFQVRHEESHGGGIHVRTTGRFELIDSTITGNVAEGDGAKTKVSRKLRCQVPFPLISYLNSQIGT